jgi:AraC family transcriptional activator of pobA
MGLNARRKPKSADRVPAFFLYGEALRPPDERTVHVETIEARSRLHDWHIRPHRHRDLHQVLIVWRGRIDVQLDGDRNALSGPALVIVPPGTVHAFRFARDTDGLVVTFAPELAREVLHTSSGLIEMLDKPTVTSMRARQIGTTDTRALGAMLLREFARSALGRESSLCGLLGALLTQTLRLSHGATAHPPTAAHRARELVGRFRQVLEQRYREHVGVAAYARLLGCTEGALRKACLAVSDLSPIEVVHSRVLIEAERQLRYTGQTVTQIAYFLGYEDPAYFSRFFTRRMGVTPRAFRGRPGP